MIGFISIVIVAILFAPMFYHIHKRLERLENELSDLKTMINKDKIG